MNKQFCILSTLLVGIIFFLISSCNSQSGRYNEKQHAKKNGFAQLPNNGADNSGHSISICSWNLCDFGHTKSDSEIHYIANNVNKFDVIAIQEIVAGEGGSEAVVRLFNELNILGFKWDYSISDPTSSNNSYKVERYAYIWKPNHVTKIGNSWLEKQYNIEIDREPFLATFKPTYTDQTFTLVNFHGITKDKQPETEIKYFKFMPEEYPSLKLIFCGDFNCIESHTVFNPLKKQGYTPIFTNQKTSLKDECIGEECLASEFDNVFYNASYFEVINSGIIPFYMDFPSNHEAKKISDHVPIYFQFSFK